MTDQKPSIQRSWLCEKCGAELKTHDAYKAHKVEHQLGKPLSTEKTENVKPEEGTVQKEPAQLPQLDPDRKPIQLRYVFEGNCPSCGKKVDTLEIDVEKEHFVLAYCTADKKQLEQRKVARL